MTRAEAARREQNGTLGLLPNLSVSGAACPRTLHALVGLPVGQGRKDKMGLDTTHGCWHGAYSDFMRWRCEIAKAAGLPPLQFMEGFYDWEDITHEDVNAAVQTLGFASRHEWARDMLQALYYGGSLPIKWDCLKPSPLHALLNHSDCEGDIPAQECAGIADAMEAVLPELQNVSGGGHIGDLREKTQAFIAGLRLAAEKGESVEFR